MSRTMVRIVPQSSSTSSQHHLMGVRDYSSANMLADAIYVAEQLKKPSTLGLLAENRPEVLHALYKSISHMLAAGGVNPVAGSSAKCVKSVDSVNASFDQMVDNFYRYDYRGKRRAGSSCSSYANPPRRTRKRRVPDRDLLKIFAHLNAEETKKKISKLIEEDPRFSHLTHKSMATYVSRARKYLAEGKVSLEEPEVGKPNTSQ